jgi:hypothetical protein
VLSRILSDEPYVIDLCDEVPGTPALRRHSFDFLRGDAAPGKQGVRLPVDAYYPDHHLVVEYRERQHTEPIPFMDRRMTVSGVHRGAQRVLYDQRRRDLLPRYGIAPPAPQPASSRLCGLSLRPRSQGCRRQMRIGRWSGRPWPGAYGEQDPLSKGADMTVAGQYARTDDHRQ